MAELKSLLVSGPTHLVNNVQVDSPAAVQQLTVNGKLILSTTDYGTTLPSSGTTGQIFIKLES